MFLECWICFKTTNLASLVAMTVILKAMGSVATFLRWTRVSLKRMKYAMKKKER